MTLLVNGEKHQKRNHVTKGEVEFLKRNHFVEGEVEFPKRNHLTKGEIASSENMANRPAYSVSRYDLRILSACLIRSFYRKTT